MGTGPGDLGILDSVRRANYAQDPCGVSLLSDGRDLGLPPTTSNNFFSQVPSWSNFGFVNNRDRCPLSSFEDIAYHFCYRYYSLLDGDSASMYSLYSKDGQMSRMDLNGKRVVAVGHGEIRNYYSQFAAIKTSANLTNVEVSCIGANAALLLVAITGTLSKTIDHREEVYYLSQAVVLSGDFWRSRFHILNDVCIEERIDALGDEATLGGAVTVGGEATLGGAVTVGGEATLGGSVAVGGEGVLQALEERGAVTFEERGGVEDSSSNLPLGKIASPARAASKKIASPARATIVTPARATSASATTAAPARATSGKATSAAPARATTTNRGQYILVAPRLPPRVSEQDLTLILSRHVSSIGGLVSVAISSPSQSATATSATTTATGEKGRMALVTLDSEAAYKMLLGANVTVAGSRLHLQPFKPKQQSRDGQHLQHSGRRLGMHAKAGGGGGDNSNTTATPSAGLASGGGGVAVAAAERRMHAGARL